MYLIFDTETNGIPNPNIPFNHPAQARVVSLAAIQLNEKFEEVSILNSLIKPDGKWIITEKLTAIHGITTRMCEERGRALKNVIEDFVSLYDGSKAIVAHNFEFDNRMMQIELKNAKTNFSALRVLDIFCTMQLMMPICKLPFKTKRNFGQAFKWPKLAEAYSYCFNEEHLNAHDGLSDARATARIFKWLVEKCHLTLT